MSCSVSLHGKELGPKVDEGGVWWWKSYPTHSLDAPGKLRHGQGHRMQGCQPQQPYPSFNRP